jgi:acetyltransferase-like isoleucine patch superfamily enzyme
VWIGSRVTILPGTEIGRNSIVGAGAVVKGVFPENVIIAGNPGKVIKGIEAL